MVSAAAAPIAVEEISHHNAVSSTVRSNTFTHEQVAQRAFEIWEREGKIEGRDQEHWFLAIAELTSEACSNHEAEDDVSICDTPQTVRTPRVTSVTGRSHYSVYKL